MRIGMGQISHGLGGSLGSSGSSCPGSPLDVQTVYNLARNAGFTPDVARSMVAIAQRESSLNPSCLATSVAGSTEASYGLWQINMSGSLGPQRLALFGLSNPSQLLDPTTNAMAAYRLSGGSNLSPWHIDSDTVIIPYRTRYLNFLAALPPPATLEASYSGAPGVDATDQTTSTDLTSTEAPALPDQSTDVTPLILAVLGAGLLYMFFGR